MSNGINKRQNESNSIAKLAAQRQLYDDAKKINTILIAISVWIPFVFAIILCFLPCNTKWNYLVYILSIISVIASFFVEDIIKEKKKLAAYIQQQFDSYVYAMPWNERLFGKNKNVDHQIANYSKKILNNTEEKNKLFNWYSSEVDTKRLIDGILACQNENFWWDVGLRKRFKWLSVIGIITFITVIVIMGVVNNESVPELLWRLAFIAPMLQWLLETIKQLNADIRKLNELDENINNGSIKEMSNLQDIQKIIFEHRQSCYTIPNWIYYVFKDNDEDKAHRTIMM